MNLKRRKNPGKYFGVSGQEARIARQTDVASQHATLPYRKSKGQTFIIKDHPSLTPLVYIYFPAHKVPNLLIVDRGLAHKVCAVGYLFGVTALTKINEMSASKEGVMDVRRVIDGVISIERIDGVISIERFKKKYGLG